MRKKRRKWRRRKKGNDRKGQGEEKWETLGRRKSSCSLNNIRKCDLRNGWDSRQEIIVFNFTIANTGAMAENV